MSRSGIGVSHGHGAVGGLKRLGRVSAVLRALRFPRSWGRGRIETLTVQEFAGTVIGFPRSWGRGRIETSESSTPRSRPRFPRSWGRGRIETCGNDVSSAGLGFPTVMGPWAPQCCRPLRNDRCGCLPGNVDVAQSLVRGQLAEVPGGRRNPSRASGNSPEHLERTSHGADGVHSWARTTHPAPLDAPQGWATPKNDGERKPAGSVIPEMSRNHEHHLHKNPETR